MKKLLWRMKNGEVPLKREPKVAVVMIGTEDLVSPACADPITAPRTAAELRGLLVYMHRCRPSSSTGNLCSAFWSPPGLLLRIGAIARCQNVS